jgi:adenosine kinase
MGMQYLLPPDSVVYFGCVGKDKYADILQAANKEAGLQVRYRYDDEHPTGRCGVIITGHNRSLCTDLAAANHYKIEHLKENWDVVQNSKAYFVGGFHLTVCVPAIMALAEEAAKEDKVFALSLSAPFIPQFFKDPLDETAPYWDYVIGNETEAMSYADSHDLKTHDIPTIAKHLANLPKKNNKRKRTAIITQGTDPTVVAIQGDDNVKSIPVHAISENEITDTTGAGDAFAAGFMAGVVKGESLERSVDMGQWLAALSLRELGPSYVLLEA